MSTPNKSCPVSLAPVLYARVEKYAKDQGGVPLGTAVKMVLHNAVINGGDTVYDASRINEIMEARDFPSKPGKAISAQISVELDLRIRSLSTRSRAEIVRAVLWNELG